jgi:hypothetical protein
VAPKLLERFWMEMETAMAGFALGVAGAGG